MRTAEEKLKELQPNSVWVFTKQETDFDESYKSALLFSEIPNKSLTNIESYFTLNHSRYNIQTDRHRILVIPQFFGLMFAPTLNFFRLPVQQAGSPGEASAKTNANHLLAALQQTLLPHIVQSQRNTSR